MSEMRRREFITLLGGAAAWPLAARGRKSRGLVFSFQVLRRRSSIRTAAFRQGCRSSQSFEPFDRPRRQIVGSHSPRRLSRNVGW
jgi:hypothetical protein